MSERYECGLSIRKKVLGEDHVQRSLERADDFTRPLQNLVTEYCWGEVWGNDSLSHKTRSMLNIAMIAILNRSDELAAHVKGGIKNGCTANEIRDVLIQVAIYGGVPAALDATRVAHEALIQIGALDREVADTN